MDYLQSVRCLGRNSILLADAKGHLSVFEIGNLRCGLRQTVSGTLVNTNHFVSPALESSYVQVDLPDARRGTFQRYERVVTALNAALGRIDIPFTQDLMTAHGGPLDSICCHADADKDLTTISTSIFLPARRKMLFCYGLPCQGHYDEFVFETVRPARSRAV